MAELIYFDHSATTPLDPRVLEAMQPFLGEVFGNPSSLHWAGRQAHSAIDQARQQVADLFHAAPEEIFFTASGTESDNMALVGIAEQFAPEDCHIITSSIEHPAILETCKHLERRGYDTSYLPVTAEGVVQPASLVEALRPNTRLVSVMAANNVVGTLQPIAELCRIAHQRGALFHTDAVQAAGKIPLFMENLEADMLSLSAHKLHGPKGIGALYVRGGVRLEPLVHGGGQERGLRSATENVAGIVGLGQAAEIARLEMSAEARRLVQMRDRIISGITAQIPNAYLIGHPVKRLPGHICLGFAGQEGESIKLLLALDEEGIAISSGSACSAHHAGQPSYILMAMGMDPIRGRGSLRVTLGRFNTDAEIDHFLDVLPKIVADLRPVTSRAFISDQERSLA
jgi:cysteine desulfurase